MIPLDYYYANKREEIDALEDNIHEAIGKILDILLSFSVILTNI